jgi:hypothetical protein
MPRPLAALAAPQLPQRVAAGWWCRGNDFVQKVLLNDTLWEKLIATE